MAAKKPTSAARKTVKKTTKRVTDVRHSAVPKKTTAVRNSPIPKKVTPAKPAGKAAASASAVSSPVAKATAAVTHDTIARRAYEISQSAHGGSELDNWLRAERELRGI